MMQGKKKVYLWKILVSLKLGFSSDILPSAIPCLSKDTGGRNRFASTVSIPAED